MILQEVSGYQQGLIQESGDNGTLAGGSYFKRIDGLSMSAVLGDYIPYDITIIGIAFQRSSTGAGNIEVHDDGVSVASIAVGAALGGSNMTLNADILAGSNLSTYWNSGTITSNTQVKVYYKRKAT